MKKAGILLAIICTVMLCGFRFHSNGEGDPVPVPEYRQQQGDPGKGYEYLVTGDFLKSGVPYGVFVFANGKDKDNLLNRSGKNATVGYGYNVIGHDSVEMVIPTCLQCHASVFEGQLIIGLGNTTLDFSNAGKVDVKTRPNVLKTMAPKQYKAAEPFFNSLAATYPFLETEVRGVNPADKLAAVLAAHRDPETLQWSDSALLDVPEVMIPTDVPAWWLMSKKNAMFYTGFGRGDMAKFLMLSNLLTVKDTSEAREVSGHFGDVLAYIMSLRAPAYPGKIDRRLAEKGKLVFNDHCSGCHGTYGKDGAYPNLLVPVATVQTDSALCNALIENRQFIDWFNNSWFVEGEDHAQLVPFKGYIAPPLDGVWITAPYFHNGSVPTVEAVLDSRKRPALWSRNFDEPTYDYISLGWKYTEHTKPERRKVYNTAIPGYGNHGHYFGDDLDTREREAVIEYLKTL